MAPLSLRPSCHQWPPRGPGAATAAAASTSGTGAGAVAFAILGPRTLPPWAVRPMQVVTEVGVTTVATTTAPHDAAHAGIRGTRRARATVARATARGGGASGSQGSQGRKGQPGQPDCGPRWQPVQPGQPGPATARSLPTRCRVGRLCRHHRPRPPRPLPLPPFCRTGPTGPMRGGGRPKMGMISNGLRHGARKGSGPRLMGSGPRLMGSGPKIRPLAIGGSATVTRASSATATRRAWSGH